MVQNQQDRKFCVKCQRNVFPTRDKPEMALLILLFIFVIPGLIYLIFYGFKPKNRCPICYSVVSDKIDYHYPPFRNGDPDSYDPSLIGGTVIRTESTIMNPEGDFLKYIPPVEQISPPIPREYCKYCGMEFQDPTVAKCPNCGTSRSL
ncbi:MAG: hypothetical protein JW776_10925 [Candidatus Lokiarchaeota archaeon]|nr:hypothetical protein [Candidatus Lokiarchaeota archaeon]